MMYGNRSSKFFSSNGGEDSSKARSQPGNGEGVSKSGSPIDTTKLVETM
jgi:hypothetical protein